MKEKVQYYIVDRNVLPEVFLKVVEAKKLLEVEKIETVQEATEKVGISRSSFYKYKDAIFPFYEKSQGKTLTLLLQLEDEAGQLSDVLNMIADAGANILTINQMIPINGIAHINICMETSMMKDSVRELMDRIETVKAVQDTKILARE